MHAQRAWGGGSRAGRRLLNGPQRAQSKALDGKLQTESLVYCDVRHTSVARDMMVSQ